MKKQYKNWWCSYCPTLVLRPNYKKGKPPTCPNCGAKLTYFFAPKILVKDIDRICQEYDDCQHLTTEDMATRINI